MALEEAINANTAAVALLNDNFEKFFGAKAGSTAAEPRKPGRPRTVKFADVKAIAEKVRTEKGKPAAVALIQKHGAASLAALDEAKYSAFVAAAEVVLNESEPDGDPEDDAEL